MDLTATNFAILIKRNRKIEQQKRNTRDKRVHFHQKFSYMSMKLKNPQSNCIHINCYKTIVVFIFQCKI